LKKLNKVFKKIKGRKPVGQSEIDVVFLKTIGVYPVGSTVLFNNSAIGRIIETRMRYTLRLKAEIIVSEYGERLNIYEVVDLFEDLIAYSTH